MGVEDPVDKVIESKAPVIDQGQTSQDVAGDDLLVAHREKYVEEEGPTVQGKLAELVNIIWEKDGDKNKSEVKECYHKYLKPRNVNIQKVDMNEEVLEPSWCIQTHR